MPLLVEGRIGVLRLIFPAYQAQPTLKTKGRRSKEEDEEKEREMLEGFS